MSPLEVPPPLTFLLHHGYRRIRSYAGAIFEDAGFTDPEVHQTAIIDEIVIYTQDETRMRLWPLIAEVDFLSCPSTGSTK